MEILKKGDILKTILFFGDSPAANTGLGTVAREILARLQATGRYRIICWGVNHWAPYTDPQRFPYAIYAAGLNQRGDIYGVNGFLKLAKVPHDLLFSIADLQIIEKFASHYRKITAAPWVAYIPVDADLLNVDLRSLAYVTVPVAYTEYGRDQLARHGIRAEVIYHGCDTETFRPAGLEQRRAWRASHFGIDEATFLVMAVARNQWRKDLARTMLGFARFHERHPDSRLYLHSKIKDVGGNLITQSVAAGLETAKDIIFTPPDFDEIRGIKVEILNELYNCADAVVSTSLGEGWGMSATEAFSTGAPFLGPRNTSLIEIVGRDEERGWLADCGRELVASYGFDDHLRPLTDLDSWVAKLEEIYFGDGVREKTAAARAWVEENTWDSAGDRWVRLIEKAGG